MRGVGRKPVLYGHAGCQMCDRWPLGYLFEGTLLTGSLRSESLICSYDKWFMILSLKIFLIFFSSPEPSIGRHLSSIPSTFSNDISEAMKPILTIFHM